MSMPPILRSLLTLLPILWLIIALAVRQSTLVPYAWISNRLHMGIPKSMGTLLHRAKKMAETDLKTRAWIERLSS